jgi:hypothetical protein
MYITEHVFGFHGKSSLIGLCQLNVMNHLIIGHFIVHYIWIQSQITQEAT